MLAVLFWALRGRAGERNDLIAPRRADSPRPAAPIPAPVAPGPVEVPEALRQELWKLVHTGNPIMAIKLVRPDGAWAQGSP
ncbi:hypothetical protein [Sphingomonas sp. MS122]|uniref:hypothetical protein n=1 Tax=Sphingomonas sp. MS122 TaxID=3412683 RepID=UPI003C2F01B1